MNERKPIFIGVDLGRDDCTAVALISRVGTKSKLLVVAIDTLAQRVEMAEKIIGRYADDLESTPMIIEKTPRADGRNKFEKLFGSNRKKRKR